MTERKTLNRYYPVDYDPSKIPKLKQTDKDKNRLWGIRVMAPFNMRCNTCGDYIYKGKKFNSKKETVTTENYLGIQIHRFYIRCPKCVAVIAFKTDPENCDYTLETGATRNFEASKTLMEMEKKKQQAVEEEEAANPMKVLENRTKQSRNEMDMMEALTELREMNARHEKVDHEGMIKKAQLYQQELDRLQKEEEDRLIRELFGATEAENGEKIKRLDDSDEEDDDDWEVPQHKRLKTSNCTDLLTDNPSTNGSEAEVKPSTSNKKSLPHKQPNNTKALLSNLVRLKKPNTKHTECNGSSASSAIDSSSLEKAVSQQHIHTDVSSSLQEASSEQPKQTDVKPTGALGMLGDYSSSSDSDSG